MPATVIFIAKFDASKNADYSRYGGPLTATVVGTNNISGGKLVFNSGAVSYLRFNPIGNFPVTQIYSVRFKMTPGYSGNPATQQDFFSQARNFGDPVWLTDIRHEAGDANLRVTLSDDSITKAPTSTSWVPVSGQEYEILITADFANGNYRTFIDGVLKTTVTGAGSRDGIGRPFLIGANYSLDSGHFPLFSIRDFALYEGELYSADYTPGYTLTVPTASSDPGIANVKTGVAYAFGDVPLTGTYDGSDRWTDPGEANVRNATAYKANSTSNNKTGTLVAPSLANTKTGVAGDGGTGTYDGSDRWTAPSAGDLRNGTQLKNNSVTLNLTGTLVAPSLANTKTGVAGDGGTGTYDGSDRHTDPGVSHVRSGEVYKSNSVTNNRTGTLVVPSLANTKTGVAGDGGNGTYDGSDRWTDLAESNVKHDVAYKANSTSNNKTGNYEGSDQYSDPGTGNVLEGVEYEIDGDAKVGTLKQLVVTPFEFNEGGALEPLLADMGVPVSFTLNAVVHTTFGILDASDETDGVTIISTEYALTCPAHEVQGIVLNQAITVNNEAYTVRELPRALDDGKLARMELTKV